MICMGQGQEFVWEGAPQQLDGAADLYLEVASKIGSCAVVLDVKAACFGEAGMAA